jgi:hypothetical protein
MLDSAMAAKEYTTVEAAGREVRISSPSKVYLRARGPPADHEA